MNTRREGKGAYLKKVSPITRFVFILAIFVGSFFILPQVQAAFASDIQLMPSISSPTLKNGQTLKITVLAKSVQLIQTARATISDINETLDLKLTSGNANAGIWSAEWQAHSLKEQEYKITLVFTDVSGYSLTDDSLNFSDPTLGRTSSTGSLDTSVGMRNIHTLSQNVYSYLTSAVIDTAAGFAYFGTTNENPGFIIKINLSDFSITNTLILNEGETNLTSAVIDTTNGFAYFGANTNPGVIIKVRLSDFTRVGALTLETGEITLTSAVIDPTGGFAYFGANTSPGKVIKIQLSDFTRVGALTFNTGENGMYSAVIDPVNDFAYFGANNEVVKVKLSDLTRVSALSLYSGYVGGGQPSAAVIDTTNGYAYFSSNGDSLADMAKIRLSNFTRAGTFIDENNSAIYSAVIDTTNGFIYYGSYQGQNQARVVKLSTGDFYVLDSLDVSSDLNPGGYISSAVVDISGGFAYFGNRNINPGKIIKVRLSDFTKINTLVLNAGEYDLTSAVIDSSGGFAYFGANTSPGKIVKIQLSDFTRVGVLTLGAGENGLRSAVVDNTNHFAYFSTNNVYPGIIIKIQLSDFTEAATLTLEDGESFFRSAVIDVVNGFAYFGTSGEDVDKIVKIRLSDFTRVGALNVAVDEWGDPIEWNLNSGAIDPSGGFAYFGVETTDGPSRIIKVRLSDFTRAAALDLSDNFGSYPMAATVDSVGGYAYFGVTDQGGTNYIAQIQLSDFTFINSVYASDANFTYSFLSPSVIDTTGDFLYFTTGTGLVIRKDLNFPNVPTVTSSVSSANIYSAVIDTSGGFAYFGTNSTPGKVIKIQLSDFTRNDSLTLATGENNLTSAVIDPAAGFVYFGASTSPGKIVKIQLSDFTRVGALTLQAGENTLTSAVIDSANNLAYFGTDTSPGKIVKIQLSDFSRTSALTLETNENNLRSAVIDATNGFAYFGTHRSDVAFVNNYIIKIQLSNFTRTGGLQASPIGGSSSNISTYSSGVIDVTNGFAYFAADNIYGYINKAATSRYKNYMAGYKVTLSSTAANLFRFRFYSSAASGNLRLALYDSAKNLVWQSDLLTNATAGDWITVATSQGAPTSLTNLAAGDYWLVFQTNAAVTVPVLYIGGGANDGFEYPFSFASFPSSLTIASPYYSNRAWSFYAVYDPALIAESESTTVVREGGETDTYTVVLQSQPIADVVITPTPNAQVMVSPSSLTFTAANWDTPQTVTVTAVDDLEVENVHAGTISHAVVSADGTYNNASVNDVTVVIMDNDGGAHYTSGFTAPLPDFNLFPPLLAKTILSGSGAEWTIKSLSTNEVGHKLFDADKQLKAAYIKGTDYAAGGTFVIKSDAVSAPNTLLPTWTLAAYDSAGKQSSSLTLGNIYTPAAAPSKININPPIPIQIINLQIDGGQNPALTEYAIRVDESNQKWVDQVGGFQTSPVWLAQTSWVVKDAVLSEAHTYAAQARNGNGVVTDFSPLISATAYKGAVLAITKTGSPPSATISVLNVLASSSGGAGVATASLFLFSSLLALSLGRSRPKNPFSVLGGFFRILCHRPSDSFAHFIIHEPQSGACPISFTKYKNYARCAKKSFLATIAFLILKGGLLAALFLFAYAGRADVAVIPHVTHGSLMDCTIKVTSVWLITQ
ncbi:MAG: hypothetical protein Q8M83_04355 [bacterium]|nr:hypothetical protein [bacterium]